MEIDFAKLIKEAICARENAHVPYSHFKVGAALLCSDGTVFHGCNIENASYGATNCAERTAIFSAIANGKKDFKALAVVGGKDGEELLPECMPCGICRQVLVEFCTREFPVALGGKDEFKVYKLKDLLPFAFTKDSLD